MGKPYRFRKKLIYSGGSYVVVIPAGWLSKQAERLKKLKIIDVIMEVYKDKIVIFPAK